MNCGAAMPASLAARRAFATTCSMSHGARNCPLLKFTGFPPRATASMKCVWRHKRAGVWSTSTTSATGATWLASRTSVRTGTPIASRISARIARPSPTPTPRKPLDDVRFALSKDD
jgi:hypothetical protein